jgi:glycosyltransferase involved in cell wall biosynthesis
MRLLYLHYGPQSGVTDAITARLAGAGLTVVRANPAEGFLYQLRPGSRLPNARPVVIRAVLEAMRAHGIHWKSYYLHTPYAFDQLSAGAARAIRRTAPDVVLQAGVLFSPGPHPEVPFHLYLDHTRAIAERYPALPGLPPPPPPQPAWRSREQAVFRGAAAIFTMSAFVQASLVEDYGVDPARVHVVGAGPNVVAGPGGVEGARGAPLVLFVGKCFVPKGGPVLLDAFAAVRRAHPRARLAVVSQTCPAPLPEGVTFHGPLDHAALARLYARAAVFALPTLREAFGLSLLEAMGFGLPVVATRLEAIPEIVSDGETGLLVPPRDADALGRTLVALLDDPARARRMGAAGRARALARFGWERAAAAMLPVLQPAPGAAADEAARSA